MTQSRPPGTRIRARAILELVAQGWRYEQILARYSALTYKDIFAAAKEGATALRRRTQSRASRLEEIRAKHPRAYEKWSPEEETELSRLHSERTVPASIASLLQRQPGAITSRLRKLGLLPEEPAD